MKIAFVTSCLEPGCDGVGDYTALLTEECERQGHTVTRIALNDPFIQQATSVEGLLRLSSREDWSLRAAKAHECLREFQPDFVSLQFVCYGFHPRGLVGQVASQLRASLAGRPLQVMFHELWIGEESGATWKSRAVGWLQQHGVLRLMRSLAVRVIHTSNAAYVFRLGKCGLKARQLPLFGSLPKPLNVNTDTVEWTAVLFGTLHPIWPPEPLLAQLRKLDGAGTIIHAGRIGAGLGLWQQMERDYAGDFTFRRLGELPPAEIAELFASASFGVATTPWAIIGKSASVAAMLDCGLPVVVNRDDVQYAGYTARDDEHPLLVKMSRNLPTQLRAVKRMPPRLRLPEVAAQFLSDCAEVLR